MQNNNNMTIDDLAQIMQKSFTDMESRMTTKNDLTEKIDEVKRHIGVLNEHFEHQVKLIAEGFAMLERQVESLRKMVIQNTEDIKVMQMDIQMIKMDIQAIKQELKIKVDREEFNVLEKRVALLENRLHSSLQ